jgi:dTDP-4-amino-4,6-dideoxygalactose transaminase
MSRERLDDFAIHGGHPISTKPFAPWPFFDEELIAVVTDVLRSGRVNYWTGEQGRLFEKEFAEYVQVPHAVAVANGTLALELALYALNIGPGDEVIVTSRTFVASASSVVMRGALPVFADVDPSSQNITAETIRASITPRTKAIIAVHLAGWPCDMDPILDLAHEHGLKVIEDCAQANGARYKGRAIGSLGDVAAFSFCQDKILSTGGEGGMLTTRDEQVWKLAWSFKDHGKCWDTVYKKTHAAGFRWLHKRFGTNWRLTEMQCALGRGLLRRLDAWVETRRSHAHSLEKCFSQIDALRVTVVPDEFYHAYYKYYVFIKPEKLASSWSRDRIIEAINAEGIPCYSGSCSEIYLEQAFGDELRPEQRLRVARRLGEDSLMFLVHPTLTTEDMQSTCRVVERVMRLAGRRSIAA